MGGKKSIIVPVHRKSDRMDCNNYRGISLLFTSYKILSNMLLSTMTIYTQMKLQENINEGLGEIDQPSTTYLAFSKYLKRSGNTIRRYILFIDFEKAYNSIKRESLYDILITRDRISRCCTFKKYSNFHAERSIMYLRTRNAVK